MPIFEMPLPRPEPKSPTPEITPKPFKHSIVDSKKTPIMALTTAITGSSWIVDYYSQVLGEHENLKAFDPKQLSPYQQYRKIHRFELKLQGALSTTDETGEGRMSVNGSANIIPIPGFIPNVHDAFIADVGEGIALQFTVTSVQKFTVNNSTAYNIDFRAARLADENITKLLDSKVVTELHWTKDFLIHGQNPLLITEDYNAYKSLETELRKIAAHWLSTNFSYSNSTVLVPKQNLSVYDPYVTDAFLRLVNADINKHVKEVIQYNCDDFRIPKYTSIYQAIIEKDKSMLFRVFKDYQVLSVNYIAASSYQNSVRYSGIEYIVVPDEINKDADNDSRLLKTMGFTSTIEGGRGVNAKSNSTCFADPMIPCNLCCTSITNGLNGKDNPNYDKNGFPLSPGFDIPEVPGEKYVFSEAFYKEDRDNLTKFEELILDLLDNKPTNYVDVKPFIDSFYKWTEVEQYYLGPVLIALIRNTIRSL